MKNNFKKIALNTIIGLGIMGSIHAQNTNFDQKTQSTKKDIITNLIATEKIMKDLAEINNIDDSLLYTTIQEINTKNGNPEITEQWKKGWNKYRGRYHKKKNKIYINPEADDFMSIKIWLEELSHSRQVKEGKITKKRIRQDTIKFIKTGFNAQALYEMEGTIEYEAHTIICPEIKKDFIDTYTSKLDTTEYFQKEKIKEITEYLIPNSEKETYKTSKEEIHNIQMEIEKNYEETRKCIEDVQEIMENTEKFQKQLEEKLAGTSTYGK